MDRAQRYVRTVATYGLRMRRSLFLSLMLRVVPGHARASRLSLCASLFSLWAAVVAGWLSGWLFVCTSRLLFRSKLERDKTRQDQTCLGPACCCTWAGPGSNRTAPWQGKQAAREAGANHDQRGMTKGSPTTLKKRGSFELRRRRSCAAGQDKTLYYN